MNQEERQIYNKGVEVGVNAMHKQIYGHWRHPNDMRSIRDGHDEIAKLVELQIEKLRENIEFLKQNDGAKEDYDRIETIIYNMRQTLKFFVQQYNQIPPMNEEEIEKYEAMLDANG